MKTEISLITVNYRSKRALEMCITSLLPQLKKEGISFEWLVANNSPEESLDDLPVNTLYTGDNIGFGAAINRVAREAKGEFLWLLNPDTRFLRGNIRSAIDFARKNHPALLGFQLKDNTGNRSVYDFGSDFTLIHWAMRKFLPKKSSLPKDNTHTHVDWVSGASLLIPKETFQVIRGFDEDFFLYFEDRDLCLRARKRTEAKCFHFPTLVFYHQSGTSFEGNTPIQKKHYYASLLTYTQKHRPFFEQFFFATLIWTRNRICKRFTATGESLPVSRRESDRASDSPPDTSTR
jgi:GT2 family glycosyltransferase